MAVEKKKKTGGAGAANVGGQSLTGDVNSGVLKQLQESLQNLQNNPTGGYTGGGGYTPPYQNGFGGQPPQYGKIGTPSFPGPQPPSFTGGTYGGPVYPSWGPGPPPWMGGGGMQPILGPGMKGIPPGGAGMAPQPPAQPPGPQMDWGGLMGKLQGILSPYLSGGQGTAAGGAAGGQNPMQSVMGALMGSLGGYMNQMPSGAQSGGMDWQNLAKQIQNPTAGQGGTQGQLLNDIMGLMGQFNPAGQQQNPQYPIAVPMGQNPTPQYMG